jgi:TfoX/Sxy family transcriptional regulator of competence genes
VAPMEKAPEPLKARFAAVMDAFPDAQRRQMFGYPCAFVDDQMFTGLFGSGWMVRLSEEDRSALLSSGGTPFEPMPGRTMREYVMFPPEMIEDDQAMHRWLERSLVYARSLPPKERKKSKATKRAGSS